MLSAFRINSLEITLFQESVFYTLLMYDSPVKDADVSSMSLFKIKYI